MEESAASAHWAAQHVYDKRLVTLMSKDAGIKVTARKTVRIRKERNGETGSEAEDGEQEIDGSQLPGRGRLKNKSSGNGGAQNQSKRSKAAPKKAASKPQTLPTRRSNRSVAQEGTSRYVEGDSEGSEEEEEHITLNSVRSRPAQQEPRQRAPTPSDDESDVQDNANAREMGTVLPGRRRGPLATANRKRPREASDEEDALPLPLRRVTAAEKDTARSVSLPGEDLSATPALSRRGDSPDPVMDLSTQELAETESTMPDVPDTPPGLDSQSDAGTGLPRRKRSRF